MREILVCTGEWHGKVGEYFLWHNPDPKDIVTISQTASHWPFTLQSPIKVPAGGKLECGLVSKPGRYQYNASPCKALGNPKTVVIS